MSYRILVADDSTTIQKVIKIAFSNLPVDLVEAMSFVEALTMAKQYSFDAAIIDASLPGTKALEDFSQLLNQATQRIPALILMGTYETVNEGELRSHGFQHVLKKPFDPQQLVSVCQRLLSTDFKHQNADKYKQPPVKPSQAEHAFAGASAPLPPPPPVNSIVNDRQESNGGAGMTSRDLPPPPPGTPVSTGKDKEMAGGDHFSFNLSWDGKDSETGQQDSEPRLTDLSRKGRKAFDKSTAADTLANSKPTPLPELPPDIASSHANAVSSVSDQTDAIRPEIMGLLPAMLREAVEAYCKSHLHDMMREVIAAELRRLADEKTRHLVDN